MHKKTATALAITNVRKEDQPAFNKLIESVNASFTEKFDTVRSPLRGIASFKRECSVVAAYTCGCCVAFRARIRFQNCSLAIASLDRVLVFRVSPSKLRCSFVTQHRKTWGGGIMGAKTIHKVKMYELQRARELAARMGQ